MLEDGFIYNFTVLTCTQNRAAVLPRVYRSLLGQSYADFEWLVVDNGSTDNTSSLIANWQKEAPFPIRYFFEPRRGKAFAFNTGVRGAKGRMIVLLDDDDWFVPNTLARMAYWWDKVPDNDKPQCLGVIALCGYEDGRIVGTPFPQECPDGDMIEMMYRYRVRGDKCGSDRTDLLRANPFPEYLGPRIVEAITWNRLWSRYRKCCVNEVLKLVEYRADGMTLCKRTEVVWDTARAMYIYNKEFLELRRHLPIDVIFKHYTNYVVCAFLSRAGLYRQWSEAPSKWRWLLTLPIGFALYLRDILQSRWILRK